MMDFACLSFGQAIKSGWVLPKPPTTLPSSLLPVMASAFDGKAGSKELLPIASDEKLGESFDGLQTFIEGSEGVTQHDLDTLRHVADRLPYTAWLVVSVEFAERCVFFSYMNIVFAL
jgi:hypothetical protein